MVRIHSGLEKVARVHVVDRRLLVGRNRGRSLFYLPGGGREPGESDLQTLAREVTEELGVTIRLDTVSHIGTYLALRDGRDDGRCSNSDSSSSGPDGQVLSAPSCQERPLDGSGLNEDSPCRDRRTETSQTHRHAAEPGALVTGRRD